MILRSNALLLKSEGPRVKRDDSPIRAEYLFFCSLTPKLAAGLALAGFRTMLEIQEHISLKPFNTFGIDVKARYFSEIRNCDEIAQFIPTLEKDHQPLLFLGGGSNVLFTKDYPGTVIRIATRGIKILREDSDYVFINAEAGEVWDEFVKYTVDRKWGGLENLSLIPGNVGAAPVQNIGAYGVELKDVFCELEAFDLMTFEKRKFSREECLFGYRESVFKNPGKKYLILNVTFQLTKYPVLRLDYGKIREELLAFQIQDPTLCDVREAVIRIRRKKLPDPVLIGNAGSFFKNPVITGERLEQIRFEHSEVVHFPFNDEFKLSAAWLIEQCGWKNRRQGDVGTYSGQPLVLVNHGLATGKEILDFANQIRESVYAKFGIDLETEVNIV